MAFDYINIHHFMVFLKTKHRETLIPATRYLETLSSACHQMSPLTLSTQSMGASTTETHAMTPSHHHLCYRNRSHTLRGYRLGPPTLLHVPGPKAFLLAVLAPGSAPSL